MILELTRVRIPATTFCAPPRRRTRRVLVTFVALTRPEPTMTLRTFGPAIEFFFALVRGLERVALVTFSATTGTRHMTVPRVLVVRGVVLDTEFRSTEQRLRRLEKMVLVVLVEQENRVRVRLRRRTVCFVRAVLETAFRIVKRSLIVH